MVAVYRALIDYTRHRTFDVLDVARYNDSVANALAALQSTVRRKDESKETLSQAKLDSDGGTEAGTTEFVAGTVGTGACRWWCVPLYP